MITIRKRHVHDLIIYLQKEYGLYFVEFRETLNGKKCICICNTNGGPKRKEWWIEILHNKFNVSVFVACTGNIDKKQVELEITNKKYLNAGKKYKGKWLPL